LPSSVAKHLSEEAGRCRKEPIGTSTQFGSLTDREVEVLIFVAQGWSNAEIAPRLQATSVTARIDLSPLLMKLDARGRAQAILLGGSGSGAPIDAW
jgi:DNA-binding NarL/FixJ family response regulator